MTGIASPGESRLPTGERYGRAIDYRTVGSLPEDSHFVPLGWPCEHHVIRLGERKRLRVEIAASVEVDGYRQ